MLPACALVQSFSNLAWPTRPQQRRRAQSASERHAPCLRHEAECLQQVTALSPDLGGEQLGQKRCRFLPLRSRMRVALRRLARQIYGAQRPRQRTCRYAQPHVFNRTSDFTCLCEAVATPRARTAGAGSSYARHIASPHARRTYNIAAMPRTFAAAASPVVLGALAAPRIRS